MRGEDEKNNRLEKYPKDDSYLQSGNWHCDTKADCN